MSKADVSPGLLLTAYSNNAYVDDSEPLDVVFTPPVPLVEWTLGWEWDGRAGTPADATGFAKIRGGYDYREFYRRPSAVQPHSICPGDVFFEDVDDREG